MNLNLFIQKNQEKVNGVLSGFDRLVFRGTLRSLSYSAGMMNFLYSNEVLLKNYDEYVQEVTAQIKENAKPNSYQNQSSKSLPNFQQDR